MMSRVLKICGVLIVICISAPVTADVAKRAQQDQAWGATYRALAQQLGGAWKSGIRGELAEQTGLDREILDIALHYLTSYPVDDLRVEWVLARYPHYYPGAVENDFRRLESAGILNTAGKDSWQITEFGDEIVRQWYRIATRQAASLDTVMRGESRALLLVLDAIVEVAARLDDGSVNQSIRWRLSHRFRVAEDAPLLLKLDERLWDYIAFVNDNAHYRVDRYQRVSGQFPQLQLSNLAKELFATMGNRREYPVSRCAEHRVWRVSMPQCREALSELQRESWVEEFTPGRFRMTETGDRLFKDMETLANQRLYQTWQTVSDAQYDRYLALLADMKNILSSRSEPIHP